MPNWIKNEHSEKNNLIIDQYTFRLSKTIQMPNWIKNKK